MMISSSLPDACQAHYPGDYPAVYPFKVTAERGSLHARYACWCGQRWDCWWDARAAGWPRRS